MAFRPLLLEDGVTPLLLEDGVTALLLEDSDAEEEVTAEVGVRVSHVVQRAVRTSSTTAVRRGSVHAIRRG